MTVFLDTFALIAWISTRDAAHAQVKSYGSRTACLAMMYKLAESASRSWRLLNGFDLRPDVIRGAVFQDGFRLDRVAA